MDFNTIITTSITSYLDTIKNTWTDVKGSFSGRAGKKTFWTFFLTNVVVGIILGAVITVLTRVSRVFGFLNILDFAFSIATGIPGLALLVRRLHDTGKSGTTALLNLICCVGPIICLVFAAQDGDAGDNQYGPAPIE